MPSSDSFPGGSHLRGSTPARIARLVFLLAVIASCGGRASGDVGATASALPTSISAAIELARAEADRDAGLERLSALARTGPVTMRVRAIRGIGRTGNAAAHKLLDQLINDSEPAIRAAVLSAVGLSEHTAAEAAVSAHVSAAEALHRRVAAEVLGKIGSQASLAALTGARAAPAPEVRAAAAVALGMYGRRQIALPREAILALVGAAEHAVAEGRDHGPEREPARAIRYGVAYALAHQYQPIPDANADAALAALAALSDDNDDETRALAVRAIGNRPHLGDRTARAALDDADWRVRTEGVRALASASPAARAHLAGWLSKRVAATHAEPERLDSAAYQAVVEALTLLRAHIAEASVRAAFDEMSAIRPAGIARAPLLQRRASQLNCLIATGRGQVDEILRCGDGDGDSRDGDSGADGAWPAHLRQQLAIAQASGAALAGFLSDDDPRVRATALSRALALDPVPAPALAALPAAIASSEPSLSGPVIEALAARFARVSDSGQTDGDASNTRVAASLPPQLAPLIDALVARAGAELDRVQPEIEHLITAFDILARVGQDEYAEICVRGLGHWNRTVRNRARSCLERLRPNDARDPSVAFASPPRPPVEMDRILGQRVLWQLQTAVGAITIELDPTLAPWHVAVIVHLAERGFYDGLSWHRVVANFVLQGGDPTGSGWGGPGFVVPAEPAGPADGGRFERGVVGIADAGLDTGGCQIFIMHARAPHLEGRYTRVGIVVAGMDVVDRLALGDVIVRSRIEFGPY